MTEEHPSDQSRFMTDDSAITFVDDDDDLHAPDVVDLDEVNDEQKNSVINRDWVHDPTEQAPNRWTNTETGEYRYQENQPEPMEGESEGDSAEITDYDVESEFGSKVAGIMQEGGDPVGQIYAKAWQSFAGRIDDEDLLIDALTEIADHGTQTAEDRIRQRLRGMGWESGEINRTIREAEETGEPDEPEAGKPAWEDIEPGDTYEFDIDGEERQTAQITGTPEDGKVEIENDESGVRSVIEQEFFEDAVVPDEPEDFDLSERMDDLALRGASQFGVSDPTEIEEVREISENASTEQLEDFVDEAMSPPDNPLEALEDRYDARGGDAPAMASEGEDLAHQIIEAYRSGQVNEEQAYNEADRVARQYGDDLGFVDEDDAQFAKSILWYRDDTDVDVSLDELTTFNLPNRGNRAVEAQEKTEAGISEAMSEMDPAVGTWAISELDRIEVESLDGNAEGRHLADGRIHMDPDGNNIERTAAHEFGHQVHTLLGLPADDYPTNFNFGADRDEYGFGTPESSVNEGGEEFYDDMRKALRKNWDQYVDDEVSEIRPYQKKHGVEYAAVTFAHWSNDKAKLQNRDPYAKQMWDVHAGGREYVEVDDVSQMEEGDEVIMEGVWGPRLVKIDDIAPNGEQLLAFPMGNEGMKDESAEYPADEVKEMRVVR